MKKGDREEEFYYAPTKVKGLKAKGSKKEKSAGIKHNMETFRLFDALKLEAPMTIAEVEPVMGKLEAQLEDYNAKVKVWEKERAEGKPAQTEEAPKEEEEKTEE